MNISAAHSLVVELSSVTNDLAVVNMGWRVRINAIHDVVHVQWVDLIRDSVVKTITAPSGRIAAEVRVFVDTKSASMHAWSIEYVGCEE